MTSDPISVLLVDDQDLVRYGFAVILSMTDGIEVVGEAANGRQAIDLAHQLRPDVILMDVQMPVLDGLAATRELVADPGLPSAVLILTTFDSDDYLYRALQAGASGFLLKNSSPEALIEAIRVIAAGDALLSPAVTKRVIARFAGGGPAAPQPTQPQPTQPRPAQHPPTQQQPIPAGDRPGAPAHVPELTDRESQVLALIAQGMSNSEIAAQLVVGEATVKTHVSNLLAKLGLRDRIQAVVYAYENKIVTPAT